MRVQQGAGGMVAVGGGPLEDIPRGGIGYLMYGDGVNLVDFDPAWKRLAGGERSVLVDVAVRLSLVDALAGADAAFDRQLEALALYLLCTCIDALADPKWIPFADWLRTKKAKYHDEIVARTAELGWLIEKMGPQGEVPDLIAAAMCLDRVYMRYHGASRMFGQFFLGLPSDVKSFLAEHYMVFQKAENWVDPARQQAWHAKLVDDRLQAVARYLYEYRRSRFTHRAKVYQAGALGAWKPEQLLNRSPLEVRGWGWFTFHGDEVDAQPELTVLVGGNRVLTEAFLLRTAIICHCRGLLGLENGIEFVRQQAEWRRQRAILSRACAEVQANWDTYKYYSVSWMAWEDWDNVRYHGSPEFQWQWLEAMLQSDLSSYGLPIDSLQRDVQSCISSLKALNQPVREFNDEFPPLYIRQRRAELRDCPEDQRAKQARRAELYDRLAHMCEFREARWYLGQLRHMIYGMLHAVRDQGGPRVYVCSTPDYRAWM